jgi:hypothetical protein
VAIPESLGPRPGVIALAWLPATTTAASLDSAQLTVVARQNLIRTSRMLA